MNELVEACYTGNIEKIKCLVEQDFNNVHAWNNYALRWSAYHGHLEIVKYLIEKGVDIHADNNETLRLSVLHGQLEIVNYLREVAGDKWKCFNCIVRTTCLKLCDDWNKK